MKFFGSILTLVLFATLALATTSPFQPHEDRRFNSVESRVTVLESSPGIEQGTLTLSGQWTGALASSISRNLKLTRVGSIVIMTMNADAIGGAAGSPSTLTFNATIPAEYRPVDNRVNVPVSITDASTQKLGVMSVTTGGSISVSTDAFASFGTTGDNGIRQFSVSWAL